MSSKWLLLKSTGLDSQTRPRQPDRAKNYMVMDKLLLSGQNLCRVFNFSSGRVRAMQLYFFETKLPNLKLKIQAKKLLGSLTLVIALPGWMLKVRERGAGGWGGQ
jgi:hypothetical protein